MQAKRVSPRVITQSDICRAAAELLDPKERSTRGFDHQNYFQKCLTNGAAGPTLFVLDNFETVQNTADVFTWIDTYIRRPNKVLITTRNRDFVGDYPIDIGGMTESEAGTLVDQHASRLKVNGLVTPTYRRELVNEANGHPYVIRILLGQVATEGRAVAPERIVANSDHILRALFERTYAALTPGGQRVFLLLCSWRVLVPRIAIEAILLRPEAERFNVSGAIDELERFSLVDCFLPKNEHDGGTVSVPLASLAATTYGRGKLEASPFSVSVEQDRKLLMEFGPGRTTDSQRSVLPRIQSH